MAIPDDLMQKTKSAVRKAGKKMILTVRVSEAALQIVKNEAKASGDSQGAVVERWILASSLSDHKHALVATQHLTKDPTIRAILAALGFATGEQAGKHGKQ